MNYRVAVVAVAGLVLTSCGSAASSPLSSTTTSRATTTTTSRATTTTVKEPSAIFPLTGLPATKAEASLPALEVKIDNAPGVAWPQSGINQADVVYEEVVEGGITRYMAIFQSHEAPVVGPVRSVRYSDALIVAPIGGLFAYSGGIPAFVTALHQTGVIDVGANVAGGEYYRNNSRPEPHNLFTSTIALRKFAGSEGKPPPELFSYSYSGSGASANPSAHKVSMPTAIVTMSSVENAQWSWNSSTGLYTRTTNGVPQVDSSGRPVTTNNVIIEDVPYPLTQYIDPAGNPVPYANSIGSGDAYFLIGGKEFAGTWSKPSEFAITKYTTFSGKRVDLVPGRTWVMFAPIGVGPVVPSSNG
ncbi:MAG: DUF3048 domain-containing protein [Acidimicrobiales bacterium]